MMNARHQGILRAIVQDYIRTAEPVGSRTISRKYGFSLSPATIRTIMADLEELGYVTQPHTSAGRVPTDKGYRLYVDNLMDRLPLSAEEVERIEQRVNAPVAEVDDLSREAGKLLSALSPYVAITLAARLQDNRFQRAELVSLARDRVLVILLSSTGLIHHKTVVLDEPVTQDDLDRMARYLSDLLKGRTLGEVRDLLMSQMAEEKALYDRLLAQALRLGAQALAGEAETDVYVAGASRMADQPEFADVHKMKALYAAFEEKSKLVMLLGECLRGEGCRIFIGSEIPLDDIREVSVVASPYGRQGQVLGVLAVVGPTRMDYGRTVALVETTARLLNRSLSEQAA
jgi:heat-inducible transcriptional repressor